MKSEPTPRQVELLTLVSQGLSSKEIGRKTGLSPGTVKVHLGRLRQWLKARNSPHAVSIAMTRGYIPGLDEAS